jgi:hypothetical protein
MRTIALETFKIIHKKSPLFLQDLVTIKNNIYNFRYINTADIPRRRTTKYGKNSLRYKAARLWNIHCQVRSEICPHLTSLKIIFRIGVVGKSVSAALVNIKLCCLMPE